MNQNIAERFPDYTGYKTYKGALAKMEKALPQEPVSWIICAREDGTFIPVAILSDKNEYLAGYFAHHGICVTKA